MITQGFIALAIAIVLAIAFRVWVASRKRKTRCSGSVRSQNLTVPDERFGAAVVEEGEGAARSVSPDTLPCPPEFVAGVSEEEEQQADACDGQLADRTGPALGVRAEPIETAPSRRVEDPAVGDDGTEASPELTTAADPRPQGREELDGIDDEGTHGDEWKQQKEAELTTETVPPTDSGPTAELPEQEVDEIDISLNTQQEVPQSSMLPTGESAEATDSETEGVSPRHDEPSVPASSMGPPTLPPPGAEDDKHAAPAVGARSETETEPDAIPPQDELDGDLVGGSSTVGVLDEVPASKLTPAEESPIPSAEGLAGDTAPDHASGEDSQTNREQIGEQRTSQVPETDNGAPVSAARGAAAPETEEPQSASAGATTQDEHTGKRDTESDDAGDSDSPMPETNEPVPQIAAAIPSGELVQDDDRSAQAKWRTASCRPPKHKPPVRTPETTRRTKKERTTDDAKGSRARPLSMSGHVVFGRRNRCRVSLLPARTGELAEQVEVNGPNGQETWNAYQDEWYCDVSPPNIGTLLEQGGRWIDSGGLQWVLSSRDIYVLAQCSAGTTNGYVSVPRLILQEEHVVLCTQRRESAVREALHEAGCADPVPITGNGVPSGWVLFHGVQPTAAIDHEESAGIFNVLRPISDVEIVFRGGIRLSHAIWLNGHPPQIRVRGASGEVQVMIDEQAASVVGTGNCTVPGWDTPGLHTVFCGGVAESYELVDGLQQWDEFGAFKYRAGWSQTGDRSIAICGPIVTAGDEGEVAALTPATNTCLLGAIPGQLVLCPQPYDVRIPEFVGVADFRVVWTLPANPLRSHKSTTCVCLLSSRSVDATHGEPPSADRQAILRWCQTILNASRKGLRIDPRTAEANRLWAEYKRAARRLWKQLR